MKDFSFEIIERVGALSPDGYVIYDYKSDLVEYSNTAFSHLAEIDIRSGYSLILLRDRLQDYQAFIKTCVRQLVTAKVVTGVELRLRNNRYISVDGYILSEERLMLIARDVTGLKEFQNYLSDFGARKDVILDMIAHNLGGPLHLTHDLLNSLDQSITPQRSATLTRYTNLIRQNTAHCIEIINSFLQEEHLASADVFVEAVRFDALEKIKVVVDRIQAFEHERSIKIQTALDSLYITSDDVKFFQVIHNVVSNAVKFTPVERGVYIDVEDAGDMFTVSIMDNGIGIPDHLQPYIFERNTSAGRPGLKGEKSIGMGLFIVKQLVTLMGGSITFSSKENVGTSFVITLPKMRFGIKR